MEQVRCELTELPVTMCAHCRKIEDPEQEAKAEQQRFDKWLDSLG